MTEISFNLCSFITNFKSDLKSVINKRTITISCIAFGALAILVGISLNRLNPSLQFILTLGGMFSIAMPPLIWPASRRSGQNNLNARRELSPSNLDRDYSSDSDSSVIDYSSDDSWSSFDSDSD